MKTVHGLESMWNYGGMKGFGLYQSNVAFI